VRKGVAVALLMGTLCGVAAGAPSPHAPVRVVTIHYRAWDGRVRAAYVELPAWYGPQDDPPVPLVISPHGRGVPARDNVRFWGDLPAVGRFAVVNPEGQGRRLTLYSWGVPGEISDLARMPAIVHRALPWLRLARRRIYAIGGSMGGQETLLLVARHPRELAGAISFDADTNLALRYRDFGLVAAERGLQPLARYEIGGTPSSDPQGYAERSPLDAARQIAFSGVPLELWWSVRDRVVTDQRLNSGALFRRIVELNPAARVLGFVGSWRHTAEMWYFRQLPLALATIGLLPPSAAHPEAHAVLPGPFARPLRPGRPGYTRLDGQRSLIAQSSQRGLRASQTRRPCQISRCGKRPQSARGTSLIRSRSIFTGSSSFVSPSRCESRRTWVSTTIPWGLPRSAETTFAVLRATPGSRSRSSKRSGTFPSNSSSRMRIVPRSDFAFWRKKPVWKMSRSSSSCVTAR
jgi:poly(3-hydroxybutyrate) depolymerase